MRITNKTIYDNLLSELSRKKEEYYNKQREITEERKFFNPSDDPLSYKRASINNFEKQSNDKYLKNMTEVENRLLTTETSLDQIQQLLGKVRELAELNATESSTQDDREIAAEQIDNYIDQLVELANTKVNDEYIFSGYKTDTKAFSNVGNVLEPYAHEDNTYSGALDVTGEFTGTENKEYLVEIVTGGALNVAEYRISEDGGETWGSVQTTATSIDLYDDNNSTDLGLNLTMEPGTFDVGDQFKAYIGKGKYQGDDGKIQLHSSGDSRIDTNINGQELFENNDFFGELYHLKMALNNDDTGAISSSLEGLKDIQANLNNTIGKVGINLERASISKNNLQSLSDSLLKRIQDIEKPDLAEALIEFTEIENNLNASLSTLAKIFPKSLLSYV